MEAGRRHAAAAAAVGDNFTDDIHPFVEADPVLCCTDERKVHAVKGVTGLDNYAMPMKRRLSS